MVSGRAFGSSFRFPVCKSSLRFPVPVNPTGFSIPDAEHNTNSATWGGNWMGDCSSQMKRWEINQDTTAKDFSILQGKAKIPISVTVAETWNDSRGITGKTTEEFWAELPNNLVESLAPVKPYCWLHFGQFHSRFHKSSSILFMCLKQITLKLRLAMEVFCLYFLSLCSEFLFSLAEAQGHRLVMVLFPSTVRHNFCFSHFGWIRRALWIATNGHESPGSPKHALNYC